MSPGDVDISEPQTKRRSIKSCLRPETFKPLSRSCCLSWGTVSDSASPRVIPVSTPPSPMLLCKCILRLGDMCRENCAVETNSRLVSHVKKLGRIIATNDVTTTPQLPIQSKNKIRDGGMFGRRARISGSRKTIE